VQYINKVTIKKKGKEPREGYFISLQTDDVCEADPFIRLQHLDIVPPFFGFGWNEDRWDSSTGFEEGPIIEYEFETGKKLSQHIFENEKELRNIIRRREFKVRLSVSAIA